METVKSGFSDNLEDYPAVSLRKGMERRLLYGYRWVFSNEIEGDLSTFVPGEWIRLFSSKGVYLGLGYINPHSLIAVRVICPPGVRPTRLYFKSLMERARDRRKKLYPGSNVYRFFFSESDGLPGLIVDRYDSVVVYQITTKGIACLEGFVQELLMEVLKPKALVYRNDGVVRTLEDLPLEKGIAWGKLPDELWVELEGLFFLVDPLEGHKTGCYLDQRENRKILKRLASGTRLLDLFCYEGGWGLHGALYGAREVVMVDQSASALERARLNAARNGLLNKISFVEGDVFEFLKTSHKGCFDLVVSDPPAFVKHKKVLDQAVKGYTDLNRRILLKMDKDGILISCSCSHHISEQLFREILLKASLASGKSMNILEVRGQSPDHPVLLSMPETKYLKCFVLQVN